MSKKIALVGLGWAGQKHLDTLAGMSNVDIVAIADLNDARVKEQAAKHQAHAYTTWKQLLDGEKDLDGIVLATPPAVRLQPIAAICQRKLPMFCEKPAAANLSTALQAAAMIEAAGILNTVGFQYRWHPLATKMKELVAGRQRLFHRIIVAWPVLDWVAGGGVPKSLYSKAASGGPLVEQGVHFQDALRYITADEPAAVQGWAFLGPNHPAEGRDSEETTSLNIRHRSGLLTSHIQNWSFRAGPLLQTQIVGLDWELTWTMAGEGKLTGIIDGEPIDEPQPEGCDAHAAEIEGFVKAIIANDQSMLRSSYRDACQTLAVCETAQMAVQSGVPVAVPM